MKSPAVTPAIFQSKQQLHATAATYNFAVTSSQRFAADYGAGAFDVATASYERLRGQLEAGSIDYMIGSHVPVGDDFWVAPLGVDALAIVINADNNVSDLTLDDLRDVFSGRIRDWGTFSAGSRAISPLTLPPGSDVALEFRRLVMGITAVTGNALLMPGIESVLQQVAADAGAIGYLPLSMLDVRVKALAINGVFPTMQSVGDRRYPLRSTIYVIGRQAPPPATFNFIGWLQSEAGQAVVAESYTPLP